MEMEHGRQQYLPMTLLWAVLAIHVYGAQDKMGVWSWTSPNDIQVEFPDLAFEPHFMVTNAETYEMISVPAVLQNYSSDAVLADELGSYDKKKWRLFKWSNGQYVESNVSFTRGRHIG